MSLFGKREVEYTEVFHADDHEQALSPFEAATAAYRELFPDKPSQERRPRVHMNDVPLYVTPREIRTQFVIPQSLAVLGLAYDDQGLVAPEVLPLVRGESLLLQTEGEAYRNGPPLMTLLRSLLYTHANDCIVFGWGEMKAYYPRRELQDNNNFLHAGASEHDRDGWFERILQATGDGRVPVVFMDMISRVEYKWGVSHMHHGIGHAEAFDAFISEVGQNILLIGSIGDDHTPQSEVLLSHFSRTLIHDDTDPYRSPIDLAYVNPQTGRRVQAAANQYVQWYQTHGLSSVEMFTGKLSGEDDIAYDD